MKLCSTQQCLSERNFSGKSFLYYCILTLTKLKYFMSYMKRSYCWRGDSLSSEQGIITKKYLGKGLGRIYRKYWSKHDFFYDSDVIGIGIGIPFYRSLKMVLRWSRWSLNSSFLFMARKTRNLHNFIWKSLLRDIYWNYIKTNWSFKLLHDLITTQLNSLFVFFPIQQ